MRILYLITKSNWGGAQKHVFDLATAMKERNHDVYVALGGEGILKKRLEEAGIYTFSIAGMQRDVSVSKDAGSFKEIFSIIRSKKPEILHLHSTKAAGIGAVAGRILRVKSIIYTVHGWAFNEDRPIYEKAVIAFFSWLTMIFSHTTILLSERELAQARTFPWVKNKLKLIPLGLKPATFLSVDGAKDAIAKRIGLDFKEFNKKFAIVNNAELHPNKGQTYLIDAMATVVQTYPNAICVIISDGQEKANLHMLIKEKKLEQNIYLAGYLDHASEYLKAFSLFVLPSIKEGLPYAILEAGQASLPVIASSVGGIPEILQDMKSGILIDPKNTRELAHAISFMIEHPVERKIYGNALREIIATKFALNTMLSSIEKLYSESVTPTSGR